MKTPYLFLAAVVSVVSSAQAALVVYNFNDSSTTVKNLDAVVSGADAAILQAGTFSGPGDGDVSASIDNAYVSAASTGATVSAALASGNYLTFTITPAQGQTLQLNSFSFNFGATNFASGAPDFTNYVIVQTSLGGLGTDGAVLTTTPGSKTTGQTTSTGVSYVPVSTDTSGIIFNSELTIQIRFYDDSNSASAYNRIDDLTLDITAVPELSGALLGLAGAAGLLGLRRRR